jgi:hypothetical protein
MLFFFTFIQRIKFKFGKDRKNYLLKYAKAHDVKSILEIGVFNGNFAERLLDIVTSKSPSSEIHYLGVDLFAEGFTDEIYRYEVSLYPQLLSAVQHKLSKYTNVIVELVPGDSVNILPKISVNKDFDVIHIDGGHSYNTVLQDWLNVSKIMNSNTTVFFDDYSNTRGVTKGGFGINKVVDNIDRELFDVKLSLNRDFFWKDYGLLSLRMVAVTLKSQI